MALLYLREEIMHTKQASHITDEEQALIGKMVEGSVDGITWFSGRLEEVIDLFIPYKLLLDDVGYRYFVAIRLPHGE